MFTKNDIKSGMVIEYRMGDRALVVQNQEDLILLDSSGCMFLSVYTENLVVADTDNRNFDIVKVYKVDNDGWGMGFEVINEDFYLKVIWDRDKTYITKKEIAEKFGVNIEELEVVDA